MRFLISFLIIFCTPQISWAHSYEHKINSIKAATFNIKWLGYSTERDDQALAQLLSDRDLVFIQELVAPPYPMTFPNGKAAKPDAEAAEFFDAMKAAGFEYVLSKEDTGTGDKIHINSAATEWFVAFYRPNTLTVTSKGYIAADRSNHDDYERVPYEFEFKAVSSKQDFAVISTHLKPGDSKAEKKRRYHELKSIFDYANKEMSSSSEKDYIILGDMNVYDCEVLDKKLQHGFVRANKYCLYSYLRFTEPYDHVLYNPKHTQLSNYEVIDMFEAFNVDMSIDNKEMIAKYSDHHPIFFEILIEQDDD